MDEEKDEGQKNKNSKIKVKIIAMLTPFISIILIVACFIAIVQGILDVIKGVVQGIMDFIEDPAGGFVKVGKWTSNSWNYIFNLYGYNGPEPSGFSIILDEETVKTIKDQISSQAIDTKEAGLTDLMIKKMILVNYMTSCTVDTEIAIPVMQVNSDQNIDELKKELLEQGIDRNRSRKKSWKVEHQN